MTKKITSMTCKLNLDRRKKCDGRTNAPSLVFCACCICHTICAVRSQIGKYELVRQEGISERQMALVHGTAEGAGFCRWDGTRAGGVGG